MQSQSDRDARIRERAYQIWLRDGCGHGQDEAHWHQAEREIEAEEATSAEAALGRSTRTKKARVTSEADPPTVSEARAKDEAAASKPPSRAAAAAPVDAPATTARSKPTSRRPVSEKT